MMQQDKINITAHSGAELTPQNSMEFIELALECGADGLEVDIRRNEEGRMVLSHNPPKGHVVTVEELFDKIKDSALYVNCDLKHGGQAPDVFRMAQQRGIGPQRLMFTGGIAKDEYTQVPGTLIFSNLEGYPFPGVDIDEGPLDYGSVEKVAQLCKEEGVAGLNMDFHAADGKVMEICSRYGLLVTVWTPSHPDDIRAALALRPYSITTNQPRKAIELLREFLALQSL